MNSGAHQRKLAQDNGRAVILNRRDLLSRLEVAHMFRDVATQDARVFVVGDLVVVTSPRLAKWRGQALPLTPTEFDLLLVLLQAPGKALSRKHLFSCLWPADAASGTRLVDQTISRLRQKLGDGAVLIETVPSLGYRVARAPGSSTAPEPAMS